MAFFSPLGTTEQQIQDLLSDNPSKPSYVGLKGLSNSDVLTGVTIVAGDIARFPIVKKDSNGDIIQDENLNYLMNVKSGNRLTAHAWKFAMAVNAILCGNSYSRILRDPKTQEPMEFEFYPPSACRIESDDNWETYYYLFYPSSGTKQIKCLPEDVIHWKFFSHDTIYGRSPLLSLGDEIELQDNGISTLIKFFKSGFSSGILSLKGAQLGTEARNKARKEFESTREASGGGTIVLDSTQTFTPLEIDTNVLGLISSNNYSTSQVAKCLRVPPHKLGVNSPNQSVKQLNDDYILNDLPYYFNAITSEFQLKHLSDEERHKYNLAFDTRSVTGMNVEEIRKLTDGGLISRNEGRVNLGKAKLGDPLMDRVQVSLNYVPLEKQDEYQANNGERKAGDDDE